MASVSEVVDEMRRLLNDPDLPKDDAEAAVSAIVRRSPIGLEVPDEQVAILARAAVRVYRVREAGSEPTLSEIQRIARKEVSNSSREPS